jgi:hypothetical protein
MVLSEKEPMMRWWPEYAFPSEGPAVTITVQTNGTGK